MFLLIVFSRNCSCSTIIEFYSNFGGDISEVNDLEDVAQFIEALSDLGKALVDTVAGLSINLVTNVESFETVARFFYDVDETVSVTAWVDKGNVSLLDDEPIWVEGLWSSQKDIGEETILGTYVTQRFTTNS